MDLTDHKIAEKYKKLTPTQRAQVDIFMTRIEAARTYPAVDRRKGAPLTAYYLGHAGGDRRNRVTWWPFDEPTRERTPFVMLSALVGMTTVLVTSLASASTHPGMLFLIPVYGVFLMVVLGTRSQRLRALSQA